MTDWVKEMRRSAAEMRKQGLFDVARGNEELANHLGKQQAENERLKKFEAVHPPDIVETFHRMDEEIRELSRRLKAWKTEYAELLEVLPEWNLTTWQVARILGVRRVIAPFAAGVTSALGSLTAPLSFQDVRSRPALLGESDWDEVNALYKEMERRGIDLLGNAGVPPEQVEFVRSADMRLVGQIHEIDVPVGDSNLGLQSMGHMEADFHKLYQELYSRKNLNIPIEVQNWKLSVRGPVPSVRLLEESVEDNPDATIALKGTRRAYFHAGGGYMDCCVYDRYRLTPGCNIQGPAIIEEEESTAVIGPRDEARVDRWRNLIIDVG